jgi:very-short-patch-repair endonuclease
VRSEAALIEWAAAHHSLVTAAGRRAVGVSDAVWERAQADGLWLQVAPGQFRHAATPLTFEMKVRAGAAWLGPRGALFGTTALRWLDVEVSEPTHAEFLVPRGIRSIANWAVIHTTTTWDKGDVINHRDVRSTSATRALLDYATQRPTAAELENAIDSAIRLRRTALPKVTSRLATLRGPGRVGSRFLSELLLDSGGESYLERRFLRLLRAEGLPRPECQVIFRRNGQRVARVDFTFPAVNTIIEVSGRLGHTSDRDRQRDARRRNQLQQLGNRVIEFTTADVIDDPGYVLTTLRDELTIARVTSPPTHTEVRV